jgi:hypothetical protein
MVGVFFGRFEGFFLKKRGTKEKRKRDRQKRKEGHTTGLAYQ